MKIRYFDHAATTAVREEVVRAMLPYLGVEYGNPSSVYSLGRKNKKIVEENRSKVAKAINADQNEIYFTSCGSESDNLALKGIMLANKSRGRHLITTKIEHPAILNTCKWLENNGFDVTYLNVDEIGLISFKAMEYMVFLEDFLSNKEINQPDELKSTLSEFTEIASAYCNKMQSLK